MSTLIRIAITIVLLGLLGCAKAANIPSTIQLCSVDQSQTTDYQKMNDYIKLATWRQCENNSTCGSEHHCCEIANGESRCYADNTPCP